MNKFLSLPNVHTDHDCANTFADLPRVAIDLVKIIGLTTHCPGFYQSSLSLLYYSSLAY